MPTKTPTPLMSAPESARRVRALEKLGYDTKEVIVPGGVAVLKRKKKNARPPSAWMSHVAAVRAANDCLTLKDALRLASTTYRR